MRLFELLGLLKKDFIVVDQDEKELFHSESCKVEISSITDYGSYFVESITIEKDNFKIVVKDIFKGINSILNR